MDNNIDRDNDIRETEEMSPAKKKLRGYGLFRVIMMSVFATAFIVFATIWVFFMIRDRVADKATQAAMDGFNSIIYEGTLPQNTDPVTVPNDDGDGSSSPNGTTNSPDDQAYAKYVAECIDEAKAMKEKYPDFRGIIIIEGDVISLKYPILQADDNEYYVDHIIDGTPNTTGEIFMHCRNNENILNNMNSVLYGHNMNNGTKFGQLKNYKKNNAFYTHYITVVTTEAVLTFKPFSFYKTDIYNPYTTVNFSSAEAFAEFCSSEQERSMFKSNYSFTGQERIITLSTCYGTSATERYCLHAVLVNISK